MRQRNDSLKQEILYMECQKKIGYEEIARLLKKIDEKKNQIN